MEILRGLEYAYVVDMEITKLYMCINLFVIYSMNL